MANEPMTVTERGDTVRDFAIFQLKLVLDGTKDFATFWLSIIAIVLDFFAGRGRRPRLFYSVVRASEKMERMIDLHSVVRGVDEDGKPALLPGEVDPPPETWLAELERLMRGSEADRARALEMLKSRGERLRDSVLDPTRGRRDRPD